MKRSFSNLQTVDEEIQQFVVVDDITEVDIHYVFHTLALNNNNQRRLDHLIHNKSYWQDKIKTYFPYLKEIARQNYQENPYALFAEKYRYFREMAQQFKLSMTVFYLLFPALKGDLEKIDMATIAEADKRLLYQIAAMNGHILAIENLELDEIGTVLFLAAAHGNHQTIALILRIYHDLSEGHLKYASRSACEQGHLQASLLFYEKCGKQSLTHLLYCYIVRNEFAAVEDYYLYLDYDQKAISASLDELFNLACDLKNLTALELLLTKVTDKAAAFNKICWRFRSQQDFHLIRTLFPLCIEVLNEKNIAEYMESCATYGCADDLEVLFEKCRVSIFSKTFTLFIAALENNIEIAKFLLTHISCQDITADSKGKALLRAIETGNCGVMVILLDHISNKYGQDFLYRLIELLHKGISRDYSKVDYSAEVEKMSFEYEEQRSIMIALTEDKIRFYEDVYACEEDESREILAKVLSTLDKYIHPPVCVFSRPSRNNNNHFHMDVENVVENIVEKEDIGMNIEHKQKR